MNAAIDLGNDTTKAFINDQWETLPSTIAPSDTSLDKVRFRDKREEDEYFENFLDQLDVSIASPSVKESNRFYVGRRAVLSGATQTRFDVNSFSGKSEDDLSLILILSMLAANGVRDAYKHNQNLFNPINLQVTLLTSLPIREAKKRGVIDQYKERFLRGTHSVVFHNFEKLITVNIEFKEVKVTLEGQAALVAIINSDKIYPSLAQSVTKSFNKNIQISDIAKANSLLSIDLGGKTSDFAVLENGRANINLSNSIMQGFDSVLAKAVDELQDQNRNFSSIGQLEGYLEQGPSVFDPEPYKQVERVIKKQAEDFVINITQGVSKILGQGRLNPEVVFIFGGGAIAMTKYTDLMTKIQDSLASFNGGRRVPVVLISNKYAQKLNAMGLKLFLDSISGDSDGQ